KAIVAAGVKLARTAVPPDGWVLACIGPMRNADRNAVTRIMRSCIEADGLLLETFSSPVQVTAFASAAKRALRANMPMLVSFTFDGSTLRTFTGATPEVCASAANDVGATALGVHCGRDLDIPACGAICAR